MQSQTKVARPSSVNPPFNPEALSRLAEKLHETTQALLDFTKEIPQSSPSTEPNAQGNEKEPDQMRCFRVPGFMVLEEREILETYQAEDVVDLIRKARDDFSTTSLFMRRFSDDFSIDGFTVQHIGEIMHRPIVMLNKACSILADYEPQENSQIATKSS